MTNLNPEICRKIKEARRAAGLSQSLLAREVGCKQSALSMFEQGDGTKLNDEVIEKLAKKFSIELPKASESAAVEVALPAHAHRDPASTGSMNHGYCPNPACPSNHEYFVEGQRLLRPDRAAADPVGGKYCAVCGELLERRCPNCGAPVHEGAVCSFCGEKYVAC